MERGGAGGGGKGYGIVELHYVVLVTKATYLMDAKERGGSYGGSEDYGKAVKGGGGGLYCICAWP